MSMINSIGFKAFILFSLDKPGLALVALLAYATFFDFSVSSLLCFYFFALPRSLLFSLLSPLKLVLFLVMNP